MTCFNCNKHEQGRQVKAVDAHLLLRSGTRAHTKSLPWDKPPGSMGEVFSGLALDGALLPTREREELRFFRVGPKDTWTGHNYSLSQNTALRPQSIMHRV